MLRGNRFASNRFLTPGPGDYNLDSYKSISRGCESTKYDASKIGKKCALNTSVQLSNLSNKKLPPGPGDYEIYKSTLGKAGPYFLKVQIYVRY